MNNKVILLASNLSFHENFNKDNIRLLLDMGFEVYLVGNKSLARYSMSREVGFRKFCESNKVHVHEIYIPRSPFNVFKLIHAYFDLLKLVDFVKPNFIHSHTPTGGFLGRIVSMRLSIYNIYTAHGFHFFKGASIINWFIYYPLEKCLSNHTDKLITINHEDFSFAKKNLNVSVHHIEGVGIDYRHFMNINRIEKDDLILLSIGELNDNKNHEFVMRALSKINHDFNYHILGDGPLRVKLIQKITNYNLENKISLIGYTDDVSLSLRHADIFITSSRREGLPVSVMEAMASGLPVLASNVRGHRDLIDDGKGGLLFNLNDQTDFEKKLVKLICDKVLREQMGQYNREKAKNYDRSLIREKMRMIYLI